MSDLLSDYCSNPGRDDYWTCPACYSDHGDVGDGNIVACECGHSFHARLDSQPVCTSELVKEADDD